MSVVKRGVQNESEKASGYFKKIIIGYYILATAIIIICIGIVVYDIIVFYKTGEFSLFRSLNTVKYQTIDESWNYVITENLALWGSDEWAQKYIPYFFSLSAHHALGLTILWFCKYIRNKPLLFTVLIVFAICFGIYCAYLDYIDGCVSYYYIRRVIT